MTELQFNRQPYVQPRFAENYMAGMRQRQQHDIAEEERNYLKADEARKKAEEERRATAFKQDTRTKRLQNESTIIDQAMRAGSQEEANQIIKRGWEKHYPGEDPPKITWKGKDVKFTLSDGTVVEGPRAALLPVVRGYKKSPEYRNNPQFHKAVDTFLTANGVSITRPQVKSENLTEAEADAKRLGFKSVAAYKRWTEGEKIRVRREHGDLSEKDSRLLVGYGTEMRMIRTEIGRIEDELSMFEGDKEAEEMWPAKVKRLKRLKAELAGIQAEYDRIAKPQGSGAGQRPKGLPQKTIDYWLGQGKSLDEIYDAYKKKFKGKEPKIGF